METLVGDSLSFNTITLVCFKTQSERATCCREEHSHLISKQTIYFQVENITLVLRGVVQEIRGRGAAPWLHLSHFEDDVTLLVELLLKSFGELSVLLQVIEGSVTLRVGGEAGAHLKQH